MKSQPLFNLNECVTAPVGATIGKQVGAIAPGISHSGVISTDMRPAVGRCLWSTQFELTNVRDLDIRYRLLRVDNLPDSDDLDRLLNKLAKTVNYELRQPVALFRKREASFLAIPQNAAPPAASEYGIGPHIARLVVASENVRLNLSDLQSEEDSEIAVKFLEAALRAPLLKRSDLWRTGGNGFYTKNPRNATDHSAEVDVYPGFVYKVTEEDGRLFLSIDVNVRCIDRRFLTDRIEHSEVNEFKKKHCLYQLGNRWYMVQFWGTTGSSIQKQLFRKEGETGTCDIYGYTMAECREHDGTLPLCISQLDPDSPAIIYRYPGNEVERYGALALCRLSRSTDDQEVARLHRQSVFDPTPRMALAKKMISTYFQRAKLGSQNIALSSESFRPPRRIFDIPDQVFANDYILRVTRSDAGSVSRAIGTGEEDAAQTLGDREPTIETVSLGQMGRRRLELMSDPKVGPLTRTPFDPQYLLVPKSLARETAEDIEERFVPAMRRISGNDNYSMIRVLYDDTAANTLEKQMSAVRQALHKGDYRKGYGLLILPRNAHRQFHNMLKADLWPDFQFQCANAYAISRYYDRPGIVYRDSLGKLNSYIQNCALGLLVVNRKWAWALAKPLHHEVYVGVDVLNQTAGFTFVFNGGRQIYFCDCPCKQSERLLAKEMRKMLKDNLSTHIPALGLRPKSIVLHRDGRTFESEKKGMAAAIDDLIGLKLLDANVNVGIVDIRKTSTDAIRILEGDRVDDLRNPQIGTYRIRSPISGLVCTTGSPFRFPGTAKPLAASIVYGDLNIEFILEDIFGLSLGVFTAPDKCARLPLTIKIADDLLEPIASYIEGKSDIEDEESEAEAEEVWSGVSV